MKSATVPDLPVKRPTTRREARDQIRQIYDENRWDAAEQARHAESLGLEEKLLSDRESEEYRIILAAFERSRMIIYSN